MRRSTRSYHNLLPLYGKWPGLPHPWKNPWNPWISSRSLKSLKNPWILLKILEDPWKVLEFWKWSLKSLNFALNSIHHMLILKSTLLCDIFTWLEPSSRILENPEKILEISLNYTWISPMKFRGNPEVAFGNNLFKFLYMGSIQNTSLVISGEFPLWPEAFILYVILSLNIILRKSKTKWVKYLRWTSTFTWTHNMQIEVVIEIIRWNTIVEETF